MHKKERAAKEEAEPVTVRGPYLEGASSLSALIGSERENVLLFGLARA